MTEGSRARSVFLWPAVLLAAFSCGLICALLVLWLDGAANHPIIGWIGDFVKTSGFAGLCAVVAAGIAAVGISVQVRESRRRHSDQAWWQSFEWASDRGLPRDRSELHLPLEAAVDTLNALATAARTDVQKHAVGGVVDELVRARSSSESSSGLTDQAPDLFESPKRTRETDAAARLKEEVGVLRADESDAGVEPDVFATNERGRHAGGREENLDSSGPDDNDASGSDELALWRYAIAQVGSAAESRRAAIAGYENEVRRALRHQYETVLPTHPNQPGDLRIQVGGRMLTVSVQWAPGSRRGPLQGRRLESVDVVISNARADSIPSTVDEVIWNPNQGSSALRSALDKISRRRTEE